jgi:hypothetical protein
MMVRSMIIVGMTAAIIISMPFSISNVSTVAAMIILPMVVAIMAMTIANVRGNESGAASLPVAEALGIAKRGFDPQNFGLGAQHANHCATLRHTNGSPT